jgi:hypothetical protein
MANKSYGSTRGTGVFGDAILSGLKVVVPASVDPEHEFAPVCITYEDTQELAQILLDAATATTSALHRIGEDVLKNFSSTTLRTFLFYRLRLDPRRY